ncbi:lycopene cyclase domain-containing protein [Rathayibacter sp. CAU 1779]
MSTSGVGGAELFRMVLTGPGMLRSDAYPLLALGFLVAAAVVAATAVVLHRRGRREALRRWWAPTLLSSVAVVLLTAVFDSLLIAADVIRYDDGFLSGIRLGLAPVEDVAYPLAAILLVPSLWSLVGGARRARPPIGEPSASGAACAEQTPEPVAPMSEEGRGR